MHLLTIRFDTLKVVFMPMAVKTSGGCWTDKCTEHTFSVFLFTYSAM